jgi:hypothetical protein
VERSGVFRIAAAIYFLMAGLFFALSISLGGPSLWYFICACLVILAGIIWAKHPDFAAGFCIVPLLGLALVLRGCRGMYCVYEALILLGAAAFIFIEYRHKASRKFYPVVISLMVVIASIASDKLFTNVNKIVAVQMDWTEDGRAPWGDVGPITEDGQPLIVLYRRVGDSYCYDALYSSELRDHLQEAHQKPVRVEYNTFRDFGKIRGTNIRSVNGLILNDGQRVSQDPAGFGGQALTTKEEPRCW